ncbi:MAG: universal stress protein [Pseudomonadota bacterium]
MTSVVGSEDRVEPRRKALQTRLADQQAGDVTVEVAVHDSAKEYLGQWAGREDVGLCMMAYGRARYRKCWSAASPPARCGVPTGWSSSADLASMLRPIARLEVLMVCDDGLKLSEAILHHAVALSKRLDARLQLSQVIDTIAAAAVSLDGGHVDLMESGYVHGVARRLRADHGMKVDWELHGDPADFIVSYLADCQNTMLAMTTHGRSELSQVVAGSASHGGIARGMLFCGGAATLQLAVAGRARVNGLSIFRKP